MGDNVPLAVAAEIEKRNEKEEKRDKTKIQ